MTSSNKTIPLSKVMKNLSLRYNADLLFDSIERSKEQEIRVDFKNIQFMSRSFAQQYLMRKKQSSKRIIEKNVPEVVAKMFKVVKKQKKESIFKAEDFEIVEIPPLQA